MLRVFEVAALARLFCVASVCLACESVQDRSMSAPSADPMPMALPIVELRQYTLKPGQRDVLIDLFEREFIEGQEAEGMAIVGQFRDLDRPDRFVWIRAFADMPSRARSLEAFYSGPIWQAHRAVANGTMIDSANVLLLHVARPGSGFIANGRPRPARGATAVPEALVVATICYFDNPAGSEFAEFFERSVRPHLEAAQARVLASFVTETSPNNFPKLPIRDKEHVFVWFSSFGSQPDYERHLASLAQSIEWRSVAEELHRRLKAQPEVLRLRPTPRSQLAG